MNVITLGPSADTFSPRSQAQFLHSHRSYTKYALPNALEIQETGDRNIDNPSIEETKTLRKSTNASKDSPNCETNPKRISKKIIFKDAVKGILIRKNDKSNSRIASIERSPDTKNRNSGSLPPSEEDREKESSKEIVKTFKRISLAPSTQKEIEKAKSPESFNSLLNFKNTRKVTFAVESDGQEGYPEIPTLKSCRNTSSRRNLKSISEYNSSPTELNHKAQQEILRRGPRLISEALLSGLNTDLLFKEAKSPREGSTSETKFYFGQDAGQFEGEDIIQEGSVFKLPALASARGKKTVMMHDNSYQINSERASVEFPLKKAGLYAAVDIEIRNKESVSTPTQNVLKNPLRKTASFTIGRNGGKVIGLSTESENKLIKQQSDQAAQKRVIVEEDMLGRNTPDCRDENVKKPTFSLFKRQQSFSK